MDKEEKIADRDILRGDITTAPCIFCGYSGARYWQRHSHSIDCPWYEVGGAQEREDIIKRLKNIEELGYRKLPKNKPPLLSDEEKPKVICLCGSTRFTEIMLIKQWELTKQGCIVLSWCALPDWYFKGRDKTHIGDQEGVKESVDEIHLRKIDLADEVYVINKDGYIGESTRKEIDYAEKLGKPIKYLVVNPSPKGSRY